ncbi:MAG TPA: response regulator [Kofleriaceae bacterium]|nr:response regulator [Kofleriaceae bacterium]
MGKPLRALLVEDLEEDAILVLRELRRGGYDVTHERVETPEALEAALDQRAWDVVLSDFSLPRFSGPMALRIVRERGLDLPFIIISGTVNEEIAVDAIHAGAQDFMAKGKLARLIPAIERELRDVHLRAERKKLQDQLLVSDRMASMGTLAAGVAHEINNPLASVMANLELAHRALNARADKLGLATELADVREELRDAREAAERIRGIVRDLKVFSRSPDDQTGPVDVKPVLESTLRMAWNELRYRARLVKEYGPTPAVEANEARLGQVFLNLIVNAAQAIPEGHVEENELRVTTGVEPDRGVFVEIADTGSGMPPEVLAKLFTPFFTTKPVGVGTGLGLSICHRIVTGLGGTIDVESEVGKGTKFRIVLPIASSSQVPARAPAAVVEAAARRRGKVLVVDDEPMITRAVHRILAYDHDVVALDNARAALDRIDGGERFDVILCDLMMPRMTGMELHARLTAAAPDQAARMVFLTGGAFTGEARAFLDQVSNQRIDKPFDPIHLRELVNDRIR